MEIQIQIKGVERYLDVKAKMNGKFKAGTLDNPPEYPELEILSIKDEDGNEIELDRADEIRLAELVESKLTE